MDEGFISFTCASSSPLNMCCESNKRNRIKINVRSKQIDLMYSHMETSCHSIVGASSVRFSYSFDIKAHYSCICEQLLTPLIPSRCDKNVSWKFVIYRFVTINRNVCYFRSALIRIFVFHVVKLYPSLIIFLVLLGTLPAYAGENGSLLCSFLVLFLQIDSQTKTEEKVTKNHIDIV